MEPLDLTAHPGHLARRMQQVIHVLWNGMVSQETTSPQFAVLNALLAEPDMDQKTLGARAALDRSTVADVVARLNRRGLVDRIRDPRDGRRNVLRLSPAGHTELERLAPRTLRLNEALLAPLPETDRATFLRILGSVVEAGEARRPPPG